MINESTPDAPGLARIEFGEADEARLSRLAWAMGLVGLLQCVLCGFGVLLGLFFAVQMLAGIAEAPVQFVAMLALIFTVTALPFYQGMVLREASEYIQRV